MKDLSDRQFKRILVSEIHGLGDALFCTPAIRAVRERYPDSHITFQVERVFAPVFQNDPHIDAILNYDPGGLKAIWRQIWRLRAGKFDVAILLEEGMRSTYLSWFSGIPVRVGYFGLGDMGTYSNPYTRWMLSEPVLLGDSEGLHRIDSHLRLVKSRFGCQSQDNNTTVYLTEADHSWGEQLLRQANVPAQRPLVVVHPGADWYWRCWPAERFGQVARRLCDEDLVVVILGGPQDVNLVETVVESAPGAIYVPTPTIRDLACVLAHADAFIGNDSGPLHLAAALDRPVVGLYGPGPPAVKGPRTTTAPCHVIYHKLPCSPCAQVHARKPLPCQKAPQTWCMAQIPVQEVYGKVGQMLSLQGDTR